MSPRAFMVTIPGYTGGSIIHAETASKARYAMWIRISDVLPVRLIDLQVHLVRDERGASTGEDT